MGNGEQPYDLLEEGDSFEVDLGGVFNLICCDCCHVCSMTFRRKSVRKLNVVVQRYDRKTAALRRFGHADLQRGYSCDSYELVRKG